MSKSILIVEDSNEDYYAFSRILKQIGHGSAISRLEHGDDALNYIHTINDNLESAPSIIFLDLNMPGTDGREILQTIKTHDTLRQLPVIIITTSANPRDIQFCYKNGANGYMVKPVDYEKLNTSIRAIMSYWFDVMTLPA